MLTNTTGDAFGIALAPDSGSAYLPTPRPGVEPGPLGDPAPGLAHDNPAAPMPAGNDVAAPPGVA